MKSLKDLSLLNNKLTLLYFTSKSCVPCKTTEPIVEELEKQFPDVDFYKVSMDDSFQIAQKFSIMSVPTLLVLKGQEVKDQFVGATTKTKINNWLKKVSNDGSGNNPRN